MKANFLPHFTLGSFGALGLLHFAAESFYFYWTLFWFDILMHFLGGISVGLATFWLISHLKLFQNKEAPQLSLFFLALLATLVVSFFWEVLEHLTGTAKAVEGYFLDTTIDTSTALLGAAFISILVSRRFT
ncbi:MAG: hypothetical protein WBL19_00870 [Minisyncoccia bacterium]